MAIPMPQSGPKTLLQQTPIHRIVKLFQITRTLNNPMVVHFQYPIVLKVSTVFRSPKIMCTCPQSSISVLKKIHLYKRTKLFFRNAALPHNSRGAVCGNGRNIRRFLLSSLAGKDVLLAVFQSCNSAR